jgi:hypothetical protein
MTTFNSLPIYDPRQYLAGEHYMSRLTRPAPDRSEVIERFTILPCSVCGGRSVFITYRATDCTLWGLIGMDGADSDTYGVYCPDHSPASTERN